MCYLAKGVGFAMQSPVNPTLPGNRIVLRLPVLSALVLVFAVVSCDYNHGARHMLLRATGTQLTNFIRGLDMFKADCGRYPTTQEGLQALVVCPTNILQDRWRQYFEKIPTDPWGHPYVYLCPGKFNAISYDLYSFGPDGISKSGGNDLDDINNFAGTLPRFDPNRDEERANLACVGVAFILSLLVLLYLARVSKPVGNLHGLAAIVWILGSWTIDGAMGLLNPPNWLAMWVTGALVCALIVPVVLAVSGMRKGCLISKICGWIVVIPLVVVLLLLILWPRYA